MKNIMSLLFAFAGIVLVLAVCGNAAPPAGGPSAVTTPAKKTKEAQEAATTMTLPSKVPPSPLSPKAEEYAVYSAVIQARYIDTRKPELIVISDQTGLDYFPGELSEHLKSVRRGLSELTDDVCADFEAQNRQPQSLQSLFTISVKYLFITQQEIETTFKRRDGWDIFYAKYPKSQGHMRLSRVGFNPRMDVALVYVDNMSYTLSGGGYYVLLKKVHGKWTVQNQMAVWIS